MGIDDFVIGLLTIILGLALVELASGFQDLLFRRRSIAWGWLLPVAMLAVGWTIVSAWWVMWASFHGRTEPMTLLRFMMPLAQQLSLYIAARTLIPRAMPSEIGSKFDLTEHYFAVKRDVWGALTVTFFLTLIVVTFEYAPVGFAGAAPPYLRYGFGFSYYLALTLIDNRAFHRIAVPLAFAITVASTALSTIAP